MAKRKALSSEEKLTRLLEIFHETNDVYQLKELERIAPQEKGIVMQSVKVTLQELVDSGQVETDKIAGSVFYWSFPSANLKKSKQMLNANEEKIKQLQQKVETVQCQLGAATVDLEDTRSIEVITREIEALSNEKIELGRQLQKYQEEVNFESVQTKQRDSKKFLEAANRWTDNIFMIKTWCKRKFDKQDRELNKAFGIPQDLDYIQA